LHTKYTVGKEHEMDMKVYSSLTTVR